MQAESSDLLTAAESEDDDGKGVVMPLVQTPAARHCLQYETGLIMPALGMSAPGRPTSDYE